MESRMERYKKRKKRFFLRIFKLMILSCLLGVLMYFLFEVNDTIKELNLLENTALLEIDFTNKSVSLFGNTYYAK